MREMLKVTKCIWLKSFVETLKNMVYVGYFLLDCLSIFNVFMHFSNVFFSRNPKIITILSRKNYLRRNSTLKLFFSYSTLMKLNFNFSYVFHVNRVFHSYIHYSTFHDTNIILGCQSKRKLTKIILSLIDQIWNIFDPNHMYNPYIT